MLKKSFLFLIGIFIGASIQSQTIRIDSIFSQKMQKKVAVSIILPSDYNSENRYPILYLLHWWGGNNESYISSGLMPRSECNHMIIVTPSADTSWYVNSVSDPSIAYYDFMVQELFPYIDAHYSIDSVHQAIAGFSMGGYGALMIGLQNPQRFSFIGDLSGTVNVPFRDISIENGSPLEFINNSVIAAFGSEKETVDPNTDIHLLIENFDYNTTPFIFIALGKQDEFSFMIPETEKLVLVLEMKKIKYTFRSCDGGHFDGIVLNTFLPLMIEELNTQFRKH